MRSETPAATGESQVLVRVARCSDAPTLPAVERSAAAAFRVDPALSWIADEEPMTVAEHEGRIREGTVWLAEQGRVGTAGEVVGFLTAGREGNELHVHEVSVRHDRQRLGIGSALFAAAARYAEDRGLAALTLTTFRDLPWNAPAYARLGFVEVPEAELDGRLRGLLASEAGAGLPAARRCAMRCPVVRGGDASA